MAKKLSVAEMASIWKEAKEAMIAAGNAVKPRPMVVAEADGFSDIPKPGGKSWYVPEGVCGFAWVNLKPATSRFARWLKSNGYARSDSYYGGVTIWIKEFGMSYERKEAGAAAMAKVLSEHGFRAYAGSRLD